MVFFHLRACLKCSWTPCWVSTVVGMFCACNMSANMSVRRVRHEDVLIGLLFKYFSQSGVFSKVSMHLQSTRIYISDSEFRARHDTETIIKNVVICFVKSCCNGDALFPGHLLRKSCSLRVGGNRFSLGATHDHPPVVAMFTVTEGASMNFIWTQSDCIDGNGNEVPCSFQIRYSISTLDMILCRRVHVFKCQLKLHIFSRVRGMRMCHFVECRLGMKWNTCDFIVQQLPLSTEHRTPIMTVSCQ